jgi:Sialyltransferase PMO188
MTTSHRELRLYIDSTSLSLVHQMADLVACADRPEVDKLITWLRLPLDEADLAGMNARYLPQMAAVTAGFIDEVRRTVRERDIGRIEIHANQTHAWRGVAPVLRGLSGLVAERGIELALTLYDDGTLSLLHRETMKTWPDLAARIEAGAAELRRVLAGQSAPQADIAQSHAWHHLLPTRYHVLRRDLLLRDAPGRALHGWLTPHCTDMRFDGLPGLSQAQCDRYLALFGLDSATAERLAPVAGSPAALLYTGTGSWDRAQHHALYQAQSRAIAQLHEAGVFPPEWRLAYKGHPANAEHDASLAAKLGPDVLVYPARVPLEVLSMAGLLPLRVCGVLSSSHCTLPAERIAFVLCHAGQAGGATTAALVDLVRSTGLVNPECLLPLLT